VDWKKFDRLFPGNSALEGKKRGGNEGGLIWGGSSYEGDGEDFRIKEGNHSKSKLMSKVFKRRPKVRRRRGIK